MSQDLFTTIDPSISGTALATLLDGFKDAVVSGISGTSRPADLQAGGWWVDMTNDPTYWQFKMYTGSTDVEVFRINLATSLASVAFAVTEFDVKQVSDDTTGSILKIIKNRIATNGQVLSGDTVGQIQFVGRTNTSTNPIVAYMVWTASDNQTTSAYGGTFSFYSTPAGTAAATQHLRFINGLVETVLPHKVNSLILTEQDIATSATIAQLSATKVLVEMTGVTPTSIQGLNSGQDSQVVTIHNRSSANVTLSHQDAGAASADRMKLPNSSSYVIIPDASATLYYNTTDTRWKLLSTSDKSFNGYGLSQFYGQTNSFTATTTLARVRAYRRAVGMDDSVGGFMDSYGNAYAWGPNVNGNLGLGDVTSRSSPVAVLGGLSFGRLFGVEHSATSESNYAIDKTGNAYAWGANASGQLGVGDVTARSSPVAVTGGVKWNQLYCTDTVAMGLSTGNFAYAWGINTNGNLGVGDVAARSAPTAVLGGLKFGKLALASCQPTSAQWSTVGVTNAGVAYAWGFNAKGSLGVGDQTPRSSPVAVLGGLIFADVKGSGFTSADAFFVGLTTAGAAYAWGAGGPQLGVGDQVGRSSPVAVLGGLTFSQIFVHPKGGSVYGLSTAGALYAWGSNTQGGLGVGDVVDRSSPVAVLGGLTFTKIFPFKGNVVALTADGTAYAWGINTAGTLGVGDVVSRSSPVAVLGGLKFDRAFFPDPVSPDTYSIFGTQADGTMYAWGANASGTLGLGDVTSRSSPVAVLGGYRADLSQPSYSADLTLTIGNAYTIVINSGIASFGNIPLGQNIERVEVEYLQ